MSDWEIIEGDCIKAMQAMPEASVDAIVTDPPYGLGFMGKAWDSLPPGHEVAAALLRVLKPGGHVVAFGGTRTYHRLACALEDAGFEIRDSLMWVYGSGFPKSLDVSKAIDKARGAERTVTGTARGHVPTEGGAFDDDAYEWTPEYERHDVPATDAATEWQGWGTALKPSHEPVVLARKPLVGTVAATVQQHGTGALNVDGCRVGTAGGTAKGAKPTGEQGRTFGSGINGAVPIQSLDAGRWPPNLLLTHAADCTEADCGETCPVAEMDRQSGDLGGSSRREVIRPRNSGWCNSSPGDGVSAIDNYGDSGGASRYFPRFRYNEEPCESQTANPAAIDSEATPPTDGDTAQSHAPTQRAEQLDLAAFGAESQSGSCATAGVPSDAPISTDRADPSRVGPDSTPEPKQPTPSINPVDCAGEGAELSVTTSSTNAPNKSHGSAGPATKPSTTSAQNEASAAAPSVPPLSTSRFFYCAKASSGERNAGLEGMPTNWLPTMNDGIWGREHNPNAAPRVANVHPTVKPVALMRWLCRLITPPGGTVLDPFAGSGTTLLAATQEGFRAIGIEREPEYAAIARRRVEEDAPLFNRGTA